MAVGGSPLNSLNSFRRYYTVTENVCLEYLADKGVDFALSKAWFPNMVSSIL